MECNPGMWVTSPSRPEWGIGQVEGRGDGKVRVLFPEAGEKVLDLRFAKLESVGRPADLDTARPRLRVLAGLDLVQLEQLCHAFHAQFQDRRPNTDDGRMALNVLDDIRRRGDLTKKTARQLFSWCQTGASYTEGVEPAQQICRLLYGRVPTRAEIEAFGL